MNEYNTKTNQSLSAHDFFNQIYDSKKLNVSQMPT